jgi:DNA-binding CsgD family transcriptional regulator
VNAILPAPPSGGGGEATVGTHLQVTPAFEFHPTEDTSRGRFVLRAASQGPATIAAVQIETGATFWRVTLRDRTGATVGVLELSPEVGAGNGEPRQARPSLETLTRRQKEILELVARGCAVKTIASRLGISVKTVEFHKTRLMRRLGLHGTAELTRFAVATGLVSA